jgi:hypothetical protein
MRSFIYASTANSVVTERLGRTGLVGMNLLRAEDPALPRFDGRPAAMQPRCQLGIPSRCLPTARTSSWRTMCPGVSKRQMHGHAVQSGSGSGIATGA